jgi:tRNA(Arg) A34 adenosine deaminase TadA
MDDDHKTCRHGRRQILTRLLTLGGVALAATAVQRPDMTARAATAPIPQPAHPGPEAFIARAFEMRDLASAEGDQPYGALIVSADGLIVGEAPSRVVTNSDPTAHAEMEAIRDAARRLGTRNLGGHIIYSSSHPCPMCEAAAYWAGIDAMVHGRGGADGGAPRLCG